MDRTADGARDRVDGFHPDLPAAAGGIPGGLRHIRGAELTSQTAQSGGMRRFAAISGATVGAERLWMGRTQVAPGAVSGNHHHGESETAIYVVSGHPVFVFWDADADADADGESERGDAGNATERPGGREIRLETAPGDYVFVPPWIAHREENPATDAEAVVVIARSTQEAIVINVASLRP